MVKSEPKKKPQSGGFFQKFFRKPEKSQKEQRLTVQRSIPYLEMGRDGICRVEEHLYTDRKTWQKRKEEAKSQTAHIAQSGCL